MTRAITVIANGSLTGDQVEEAKSILDKASVSVEWETTTESESGSRIAAEAAEQGADVVIAFGGDGTVRACAEGVTGTDTLLGVIPAGTGNLLARNLGIPSDLEDSITVALGEKVRRLDTGRANGELFAVIAGVGFDAEVMANTEDAAKDQVGSLAYFMQGARHLGDPSFEAKITVAGADMADGDWATILVGNLSQLQGGVELFPDSSPDDGVLEVLGISADTPLERLAAGLQAALGDGMGEHLIRASGAEVTLEMATPTRYEIDGDDRSPASIVHFEVRPRSLDILVPEVSP